MLLRRIAYAAILTAAVLLAAYFESYLTGFLLALAAALPVAGFLLSLPAMLGLSVRLTPSAPAALRGEIAAWRLEVNCKHGLSVARADIRLQFTNQMTGDGGKQHLRLLGTPSGSFLTIPADTAHCGLLEAGITRIRICDCLGLIALYRKPPRPARMPVLPCPVEPDPLPEERGGRGNLRPRAGGGPGEDYEIRDYRPGDPVRMIHWKLTCKRDELLLREVLEAEKKEPLITFDHFGPPEVLDDILDRVCALSEALIEQQRPHTLRWLSQDGKGFRSCRVESRRELERFLSAVLSDPAPLSGTPTPRGDGRGGLALHIGAEDEP